MKSSELEIFKKKFEKVPVQAFPHNVQPSPKVSVIIGTYQHEKFIGKAIESVLNQKTNFSFEILIVDDESHDKTLEIAKEFAVQHPDKIRLFKNFRKNNIKSDGKPTGRFSLFWNILNSNGEYIAWLDGDDYWTYENKLQNQVDLLESDKTLDFVVTRFHKSQNNDSLQEDKFGYLFSEKNEPVYFNLLNFFDQFYARPSTALFRAPKTITWFTKYPYLRANTIFFELLKNGSGKGVLTPDFTTFYRLHEGGVYTGLEIMEKKYITFITKYDVLVQNKKLLKNSKFHQQLKAEKRYFLKYFLLKFKPLKAYKLFFT